MRLPHNGYVLVADGRKRLFFRNEGDALAPNLQVVDVEEQDNPPDREQSSDAPGSAFASVGTARSSYEETNFHDLEEARFAADTADFLRRGALAGNYDSLVVVAPARTLGVLRKHYHKEVEQRLAGEIAKDLTGHPTPEIERILAGA